MPSLRNHVVLLCLVAGYFITVESRQYVIKDSYNRNSDMIRKKPHGVAETTKLLNKLLTQGKLKQDDIQAIIMKIIKKQSHSKKRNSKRNLRNGMQVRDFLHKLNHFINQNTRHNYHSEKRNDCNSGFGNPSRVCKRQKFRRDAIGKSKKHEDNRKEKGVYNYAQHMLVERAKSDSSSSSSSEFSDKTSGITKSRFQIISNKHKKTTRGSRETVEQSKENSEESDIEIPVDTAQHSDSDDTDSAEDQPKQKEYVSDDTNVAESSMEHNFNAAESKASTEQSESSMEASKESKYMYLQGTRLQEPSFKARLIKAIRRNDRLPDFMPKIYKWDDAMIHHLDTYWENIKAYDTYHKNFQETWQ